MRRASLLLFSFNLLLSLPSSAVTLSEAFESALMKNELVGQSRERVLQTEEHVKQAKGGVLPNLSLGATHLMLPKEVSDGSGGTLSERQTTTYARLQQPLFRGFRDFAATRQQNNFMQMERQNRFAVLSGLYLDVATSYLQVLEREQDLRNLQEQRSIYETRVSDLKGRVGRGESNSSELLTAQSTAAVLDAEMEIVKTQLANTRQSFAFLTGLPSESSLQASSEHSAELAKLQPLTHYLERITERPDVKVAKEKLSASDEAVTIAKGGHWPSLDFTGNYYFSRPTGYLEDQKWDATLQLTIPLYEGGIRQSQVRESVSAHREADLALSQLKRKAETEIRALYESLKVRAAQLAALQKASELSEKNYQVLQRDFKRGLSRSIDVQLALTEYRASRRSYDQARFQAQLDLIRLQVATVNLPPALMKELL